MTFFWLSPTLKIFILLLQIPFVLGLQVKLKFHLGTNYANMGFRPSLERIWLFALFFCHPGLFYFQS